MEAKREKRNTNLSIKNQKKTTILYFQPSEFSWFNVPRRWGSRKVKCHENVFRPQKKCDGSRCLIWRSTSRNSSISISVCTGKIFNDTESSLPWQSKALNRLGKNYHEIRRLHCVSTGWKQSNKNRKIQIHFAIENIKSIFLGNIQVVFKISTKHFSVLEMFSKREKMFSFKLLKYFRVFCVCFHKKMMKRFSQKQIVQLNWGNL